MELAKVGSYAQCHCYNLPQLSLLLYILAANTPVAAETFNWSIAIYRAVVDIALSHFWRRGRHVHALRF